MRILASILSVGVACAVIARPIQDVDFTHINTLSGLPSNSVRDIRQDREGFMWFATDGGLVRYDGKEIRIFDMNTTHSDCDPSQGFHDNFVAAIYELDGMLWIGSESGLYKYDPLYETVTQALLPDDVGNDTAVTSRVEHITGDMDGNLWLVVTGKGLVRYNPRASTVKWFHVPEWSDVVTMVMTDSSNNVWATSYNTTDDGLRIYDKAADRFNSVSLCDMDGNSVNTASSSIAEDSENNIWLGTTAQGLICFNPYTLVVNDRYLIPETRNINYIHSIFEIEPGMMAVGTNNGLEMYDFHSKNLRVFVPDELNRYSISDNFVYPITIDSEGGLWIGTFYGGINYSAPRLKPFRHYVTSTYCNSVRGNVISRFSELPDGIMAIASDDGGLTLFNPSTGIFTPADIFPKGHLRNLHALASKGDMLWVGSFGDGITAWNRNAGTTMNYTTVLMPDGQTAYDTGIYDLYFDSNGKLYAGTMKGINLFDESTNTFNRIRNTGATVIDMQQLPDGSMLFATLGKGLYMQRSDGSWHQFTSRDNSGLLHDHINALALSDEGSIYVATSEGLMRFLPEENRFERIDTGTGKDEVLSVITDRHTLWISTPRGIWRIVPGQESQLFSITTGFIGEQTAPNTLYLSSSGRIYVGSTHGFTAFYPYELKNNPYVAPLAITHVQINHRDYVTPGDNTGKSVSFNRLEEITIPYEHNSLTVKFAVLSYVNPENNLYRYRLEGYDKDWIESGNNSLNYTNLPSGEYVLNIQGANNDGLWNEQVRELRIRVLPPWWMTWWMKTVYCLGIIGAIMFIWIGALRKAGRRHASEIEHLERNKEREVYESKMKFFTMIAHEIRTPVSLIRGPLERLLGNPEPLSAEQKRDLEMISRNNNRLLNLINQLLDFRTVENSCMVREFEPTDVPSLVKVTAERFAPSMQKRKITLAVDDKTTGFQADIDAEAFTKLISNLLNNARKYTRSKVLVTIEKNDPDSTFTVRVSDDGDGISEVALPHIFEAFYRHDNESRHEGEGGSGIGLSIVKNVTEGHGGTVEAYNSEAGGAVFEVTLPLVHEKEPQKVIPMGSHRGEKPVLLFVDDNADMVDFFVSSFSQDYNIVSARDGIEALEILKTSRPDIIVSDWMMPGMDGLQLCSRIRADSTISHVPFVMLTARADQISKTQGYETGVDGYIEKPFSLGLLGATLHNILDRRRQLQEKYASMPMEPLHSVALTQYDSDLLQQMEKIISDNFSNPELSVDFLARELRVSRSTLYNKIKILVDIRPNELIQLTRLKRAAELLQEGKYRVNEICYMVGFNSPSYFTKCFQKQFGVKPLDFNRLCSGGG